MKASLSREWSLWNQLTLGHKLFKNEENKDTYNSSVQINMESNKINTNFNKNKAHLSTEWGLWNQLKLGHKKYKYDEDKVVNEQIMVGKQEEYSVSSTVTADNNELDLEKGVYIKDFYNGKEKDYYDSNDQDQKSSLKRKLRQNLKIVLLGLVFAYHLTTFIVYYCGDNSNSPVVNEPHGNFESIGSQSGLIDGSETANSLFSNKNAANSTKGSLEEVYEIDIPHPDYGESLYSQVILNHTFGNSWGHPAFSDYKPPKDLNFTHVVLQLDTYVGGIQYDRLAHIYLHDIPIWRTSTIEPGGRLSHSRTFKDISKYNELFRKEGQLMFQLDNLLTSRLTGAFEIIMTAHYYNMPSKIVTLSFFDKYGKEASKVLPIIKNTPIGLDSVSDSDSESQSITRPPLVYYPDKKISYKMPKVSHNTTSVKLELFVTGNADEEFWYGNLLDEYKNVFEDEGYSFPGHGSCRVVHVYVDGNRVSSVNPYPIIYTGGLSPALWNPIVGAGTFDIKALEVDLTSLLPIFWEKKARLEVEISNCVDDDEKHPKTPKTPKSGLGNNWISTGNIITFEDPLVVTSSGEILKLDNSTSIKSLGLHAPMSSSYFQLINSEYSHFLTSHLNFTLANGTQLSYLTELSNFANQTSVGVLSQFGKKQSLATIPRTSTTFESKLLDEDSSLSTSDKFQLEHKYALIVNVLEDRQDGSPDVLYGVNITKSANVKKIVDGKTAMKYKGFENGTSEFYISPNGNHGFASTQHNVSMIRVDPLPNFKYSRGIATVNRTIIYDEEDGNEDAAVTLSQADHDRVVDSILGKLQKSSSFFGSEDILLDLISNEEFVSSDYNLLVQLNNVLSTDTSDFEDKTETKEISQRRGLLHRFTVG